MPLLPTNPFSKTNHFGIALSITSVRGIAVDNQGRVTTYAEVPLKEGLTDSGNDQTGPILDAVKQLTATGHFPSTYAAVSLPEKFAFSREHSLPHIDKTEVAEAIGWQIEKIFPFPKNEIYWDWKMLEATKTETRVLVTAIQKKFLDQLKEGFEQAGVYPISFEPSASALSRLVPDNHQKRLIIMEVEATGTTATLVVDGISTLTTTTIIGYNTPPQTVWQEMLNSVTNLLDRYRLALTNQAPIQLVLTGEKATGQLATTLTGYLKLPTQVLGVANLSPAYHLAYVAAISTIEPPNSALTINLLPTALQDYYQAKVMRSAAAATLKLTGIMVGLAMGLNCLGLGISVVKNLNISKQVEALQAKPVPPGPEGLNLAQIQKQAQRFVTLFPKKVTPESSLGTILQAIPAGIEVSSLTFDPGQASYTLSGVSKSRTDILSLKQAIDETKMFSNVVLPLNALENTSDYNFVITFKVKIVPK